MFKRANVEVDGRQYTVWFDAHTGSPVLSTSRSATAQACAVRGRRTKASRRQRNKSLLFKLRATCSNSPDQPRSLQ